MKMNEQTLRFSQQLRKNMTKEHSRLWYDFLKSYPVQFKRQYPIKGYIVDFYCHKAKLIIELDGSQHCEPQNLQYDQIRTKHLEEQGFCVLRYSNKDITTQFRAVCENIDRAVSDRIRKE